MVIRIDIKGLKYIGVNMNGEKVAVKFCTPIQKLGCYICERCRIVMSKDDNRKCEKWAEYPNNRINETNTHISIK